MLKTRPFMIVSFICDVHEPDQAHIMGQVQEFVLDQVRKIGQCEEFVLDLTFWLALDLMVLSFLFHCLRFFSYLSADLLNTR